MQQDVWRMSSPLSTHWREASCEEVRCPAYVNGWQTILPIGDEGNIRFIKSLALRYKLEQNDPLLLTFTFERGQECFKGRLGQHRKLLERAPFFTVTRPGEQRSMMEYERWIDTMDKGLRQIKRIREG
mgnify:CR=1 FL=1